jgi:hypothetical protein
MVMQISGQEGQNGFLAQHLPGSKKGPDQRGARIKKGASKDVFTLFQINPGGNQSAKSDISPEKRWR